MASLTYDLRYREVGEEDWILIQGIKKTEHTIAGLTPNVTYEVQLRSRRGGRVSGWTDPHTVTTLEESIEVKPDENRITMGFLKGQSDKRD